ncbi:MAG: NifU family protein [Planctomycetota bacterium]|nr:NifU family protein [Planctomycetota bacterium]
MSEAAKDTQTTLQTAIDEIRPYLQGDGGDCELISFDADDGTVQLRFVGACGGCPSSSATLKHGIENYLKEKLPWVREVVQVF